MTQAMRFARWLSAGEARYEPREQVASSVMLSCHGQCTGEDGSAQARSGLSLESWPHAAHGLHDTRSEG